MQRKPFLFLLLGSLAGCALIGLVCCGKAEPKSQASVGKSEARQWTVAEADRMMKEYYAPGKLFKMRLGREKWAKDPERAWEWFVRRRRGDEGVVPVAYREQALAYSRANCRPTVKGDLSRPGAAMLEPQAAVWQFVGPVTAGGVQPSGRIIDLAVHPNSQTIYAASASGGVWKTTNQGQSWTNCTDNKLPSLGCGSIALDPNNPEIVYLGLGEGMTGSGTGVEPLGTGIYRSPDGGQTWNLLPGTGNGTMQFVVDIRFLGNSNTIVAAATGGYGGVGAGLWKSVDGGLTWNPVGNTQGVAIWSVSVDPQNPNNVVFSSRERTQDGVIAGLYYSTDGLATFTPATIPNNGSYDQNIGSSARIELTRCDQSANTLYALVGSERSRIHGLWKSTNGGQSWTALTLTGVPASGDYWPGQMTYNNCIAVNPADPNHVLFGSNLRAYKNTGGGTGNWQATMDWAGDNGLPYVHADHHVIAFDENQAGTIYMGTDGGFFISFDNGQTWEERNVGIVCTQIYRIANHPANANSLMMGCQDNDKYVRKPDGAWHHYPNAFGDCMEVDVYPNDAQQDAFLGMNYNGATMRFTPDGGANWYFLRLYTSQDPNSGEVLPNNGIPDDESGAWVAPFMLDSKHPDNIWVCLKHVYRRPYDDQVVQNWTRVVTLPETQGVDSWEYMDLSCGAADRQVYVGYSRYFNNRWGTGIYRADIGDGTGASTNLVELNLPRVGYLGALKCDPVDNNTLWITFSDFYLEPQGQARIYMSTDRGQTWTPRTGNYPQDLPATAIFIDPTNTQTVVLGTDLGCYRTADGGTTWQEYNEGLPGTVVTDFAYFAPTRTLRCGTYGRGMWEIALDGGAGEPDISVFPESLSFYKAKEDVRVSEPVSEPTAQARRAAITILSDDFESGSLANWDIGVSPEVFDTRWGIDSTYRNPKSVWCAAGGIYPKDPATEYYPGYMNTYMAYGPFSLSDATAAQMTFNSWADVGYSDWFNLYVSTNPDDVNQYGTIFEFNGQTGGWVQPSVDFANVPTLGNLTGKPQVWVIFQFISDLHVMGDLWEGAWIDNVLITKSTGGAGDLPAPTGVTATNNLPDKIVVNWNAVAGATHYRVLFTPNVDSPGQATVIGDWFASTALGFDVTGASPGVTYYFYVQAKDATRTSVMSAPGAAGSLGTGGLEAPAGVAATQNLADRVTVSWNAVTGATQYQVRRATTNNAGVATDLSGWINTLTYDDTTGDPGVSYFYFVFASDGAVTSPASIGAEGKRTAAPPLLAPTGVTATQNLVGRVTVTWQAVDTAQEYQVWRAKGVDNAALATAISGWVAALTYDDQTVEVEQPYFFYVKARNAASESPLSAGAQGQATSGSSLPAQTFSVTNTGFGTLRIDNVASQKGSVWLMVTPPRAFPISLGGGESAQFSVRVQDLGLAQGQYSDRLLITHNVTGKSPYPTGVDVVFSNGVQTPDPPATPTPADAAQEVPVAATLDWADSARATSYDLYLWKAAAAKPTAPTVADLAVSEYAPTAALEASTLYNWTVTARNASGDTVGPQWSFTTRAATGGAPDQPANPDPVNGAQDVDIYTALDWGDATGATSYDLYVWKAVVGKPGVPTQANLAVSGYQPPVPFDAAEEYRWQVVAKNAQGETPGNTWSFVTGESVSTAAPTELAASTGQYTYRTALSWKTVAGATHYQVFRAETQTGQKQALDSWQAENAYDDYSAQPGRTYFYWVQAARNAEGAAAGALGGPVSGFTLQTAVAQNVYKVNYRNCTLTDEIAQSGVLRITGSSEKSSARILWMKKGAPANATDKPGVHYLTASSIPQVTIDGAFGLFYTQAPIQNLQVAGKLKSLSAAGCNVQNIAAADLGSVSIQCAAASTGSPPVLAHTSIGTGTGTQKMKVQLAGTILYRLETQQPVQYVKVSTRKYVDAVTRQKQVSLGGIGPAAVVEAQAWNRTEVSKAHNYGKMAFLSAQMIVSAGGPIVSRSIEGAVTKLQVSGGVFTTLAGKTAALGNVRVERLQSSAPLKLLSAKSVLVNGARQGGFLGWESTPARMRVLAPGMTTIEGQGGVSGVFVAGYDGLGNPNYSGSILTILTQTGKIVGEAHVSPTARPIKFKPAQGDFKVYNSAPQ